MSKFKEAKECQFHLTVFGSSENPCLILGNKSVGGFTSDGAPEVYLCDEHYPKFLAWVEEHGGANMNWNNVFKNNPKR
jgi:hypothetical protein